MRAKAKESWRRRNNETRVSSKNQITLPVAALAKARVNVGDRLLVEASGDGRITLIRAHDALDDVAGSVPGLSAATNLQRLRDEWAR